MGGDSERLNLQEGDAREREGELECEAAVLDLQFAVRLEQFQSLAVLDGSELAL